MKVVVATVVEELPSLVYRLELGNKAQVLAHGAGSAPAMESAQAERWPSGAIQNQLAAVRNWVRLLPGDRVEVEFAEHDPTRGRIVKKLS